MYIMKYELTMVSSSLLSSFSDIKTLLDNAPMIASWDLGPPTQEAEQQPGDKVSWSRNSSKNSLFCHIVWWYKTWHHCIIHIYQCNVVFWNTAVRYSNFRALLLLIRDAPFDCLGVPRSLKIKEKVVTKCHRRKRF